MYNFSGVLYRIWGVCGVVLIMGIICILLEKPWRNDFKIKDCKIGLIMVAFAVCMGLVYASRILFPHVSSYTGEFIRSYHDTGVAPPLPVTSAYVFGNDNEKKRHSIWMSFQRKKYYLLNLKRGVNI